MANNLLTPTAVTREALRVLHQKANFIGNINRQYDDSFANSGAKIGDELKIRLPNQYTVTKNRTLAAQDTEESSVTLAVSNQYHVGMNFTTADLTMDLDDFSKRIIDPAMAVLAANIEGDVLDQLYKAVYNQVNNVGSSATFAKLLEGRKKLVDNLVPSGSLKVNLNTQDNVDLVDTLKGLFQDSTQIAKQYRDGFLGRTAGFEFMENTLMPSHTTGSAGTTSGYQINGADQDGSSLTVDTGSDTFLEGDIITIAGLNRVHPETKNDTGDLQQFVVTEDSGSSATTLKISPAIITSGAKQNVTGSPDDDAAITKVGGSDASHGISMAYHPDAFAFATADLVMPNGVDFSAREVLDGISMRIVRNYDINNDMLPCRVDVLWGTKAIRPEIAARLANN